LPDRSRDTILGIVKAPEPHREIVDIYHAVRDTLTDGERKAWAFFHGRPDAVFLSITEAVRESGIGYGTIMRFCQKLGCKGFQDFKVMMAQAHAAGRVRRVDDSDDAAESNRKRIGDDIDATARMIDMKVVDAVCRTLSESRRILISGLAGSSPLAIGFDYLLGRIGLSSFAVVDGYTVALRVATLDERDSFVAISFSGSTKDILSAARIAEERGVSVVTLTNFVNSPLVELATHSLFTATDRDPVSSEISINIAGFYVIELVFRRLLATIPDSEQYVESTFRAISDKRL